MRESSSGAFPRAVRGEAPRSLAPGAAARLNRGIARLRQTTVQAPARERTVRAARPRPEHGLLRLQRAAGNRAVTGLVSGRLQRAVGFEFELANSDVYGLQPGGLWGSLFGRGNTLNETAKRRGDWRDQARPLQKGEVWGRGPGYELQADDGPHVELVTSAFQETQGDRRRLEEAIASMQAFFVAYFAKVNEVGQGAHGRSVTGRDLANAVPGLTITQPDVFFNAPGTAKPQATVGVKLGKLATMMRDVFPSLDESDEDRARREPGRRALTGITSTAYEARLERNEPGGYMALLERAPRLAERAAAAYTERQRAAPEPTPELVSLLALIYAYIDMGKSGFMSGYAKTIAPVMGRTDFATMFSMLSERERDYYSADGGAAWRALVKQNPEYDFHSLEQSLYVGGIEASTEPNDWYLDLSRHEWLSRMTRGEDALTSEHFPTERGRQEIEGLGSLRDRTDTTAGGAQAGIYELRTLKNMPRGEWRAFALNLFDYVVALNADEPYQFVDNPPQTPPEVEPQLPQVGYGTWLWELWMASNG